MSIYNPLRGAPACIRYDVYRCLAQLAGLQEKLTIYGQSMPVNLMRTSRKWSAL